MIRRPLDLLNAAVCLVLLALCLYGAAAGRLPGWPVMTLRLGLMLAGVLLIARVARRADVGSLPNHVSRVPWAGDSLPVERRGSRAACRQPMAPSPSEPSEPSRARSSSALAVLVELYPMALVPLVFDSLGPLIAAVNPAAGCGRDAWLIRADRFLFGTDPTVWLQRIVHPWLTDVMYLAYCAYFVVPFVVAAYVWRKRTVGELRRYIFIVVLAFYVSYVGYFLVPARGPRFALAAAHTTVPTLYTTPISRAIVNGMNAVERNKTDVFPSGHVLVTAVCLLLALRESRRLFLALLPIGLGVFVSTVYCRYHYVIDVLAGLVFALPMPWVGEWAYRRVLKRDALLERANSRSGVGSGV